MKKRSSRKKGFPLRSATLGRWLRKGLVFLGLAIFGLGGGALLSGRVVAVGDGDSLTVLSSSGQRERIRLYGIDAPELAQTGGDAAKVFTSSRAFLKEVRVEVLSTDNYGRSVALVTLPDGSLLNEELVRNGQAWVYGEYCTIPSCVAWRALEARARAQKIGIWRESKPQPPWVWRKKKKVSSRSGRNDR